MIEVKNISYSYPGSARPVLRDLSFHAERGTCLAIRGDNGSGKTTLFRILNGLVFPQAGEYLFDGMPVTEKSLRESKNARLFHKRIGYLFQNPDIMLFCGSVYDEVAFGPRQIGLSDAEVRRRTEDCLDLFGIRDLSDLAPYHLSGGQKKRTALAAVTALNPDLLILDEPYAGLDRKTRDFLTAFLSEWKAAGKTLVFAAHEEEPVRRLADDVLVLPDPPEG